MHGSADPSFYEVARHRGSLAVCKLDERTGTTVRVDTLQQMLRPERDQRSECVLSGHYRYSVGNRGPVIYIDLSA